MQECPKKLSIDFFTNTNCTFKLDTYRLNVQNVTLHLQCHYRLIRDIMSWSVLVQEPRQDQDKTVSVLENQDKTKTRQTLSWKNQDRTKTRRVLVLSCLGPRQILFCLVLVLSWFWRFHLCLVLVLGHPCHWETLAYTDWRNAFFNFLEK